MLKKTWVRWVLAGGALAVPALAFAASQAAGDGGCFMNFLCPF